MEGYDEDLTENRFYIALKEEFPDLFKKVCDNGWILCIPKTGCIPKYSLLRDDFESHILVSPEDDTYRTLSGRSVSINAAVIRMERESLQPRIIHVLFPETHYLDTGQKLTLWCLEKALIDEYLDDCADNFNLCSLRDCINLLWTEVGESVLEDLDERVKGFLSDHTEMELESLKDLKDALNSFYIECIQTVISRNHVKGRIGQSKNLLEAIKLSVDSYLHHSMHQQLIKGITASTSGQDAALNKMVRNLCDLHLRDLSIPQPMAPCLLKARQELSRLVSYTTPLGKLQCLQRAIKEVSGSFCKDSEMTTDDLLSMMVFLVVKSGIGNWQAQLTFMRHFRMYGVDNELDEQAFYLASLEAAIEHIRLGVLLGSSSPEALQQGTEADSALLDTSPVPSSSLPECDNSPKGEIPLSQFFDFIRRGNTEMVKTLLGADTSKKGPTTLCHPLCSCDQCEQESQISATPTVKSRDEHGFTPLHLASMYGHATMVELLLSFNAEVNVRDFCGQMPLHHAALRGHQNALLLLLHSEADPSAVDGEESTPLHLCSANGHDSCVKAILYYVEHNHQGLLYSADKQPLQLDINACDHNGDTPLHHASRWGYMSIAALLLEAGADPAQKNRRNLSPLDNSHNVHMRQLLLKSLHQEVKDFPLISKPRQSIDLSQGEKASTSAFRSDLEDSDEVIWDEVQPSVKRSVTVASDNVAELKKMKKCYKAIELGDIPLASFYFGTKLKVKGETESSTGKCHPLCDCDTCADLQEDCEVGIEEGLSIDCRNPDGHTPLHTAIMHSQVTMATFLIQEGCDINAVTPMGKTPLHLACRYDNHAIVKVLLKHEADVNQVDRRGKTALDICVAHDNTKLKRLLEDYGAERGAKGASAHV